MSTLKNIFKLYEALHVFLRQPSILF